MADFFNLQAVINDTSKAAKGSSTKDDDSAATEVTGGKTKEKGPEMHQICCSLVCTSDKGGVLKDAATNISCTFKLILEDFVDQVLIYDHNGKVITIIDDKTFASNAAFQHIREPHMPVVELIQAYSWNIICIPGIY